MDVCSLLMALFEFEECNTLLWNFDLLLLLRSELLMCISGDVMVRGTTNANAVVDDLKFDGCIILLLQQFDDATRRRNNMHEKKIDEF